MKYEEARKKIKNGDLFAFQGTELFSRIIQRETHSDVSHVGLAVWMSYGLFTTPRLCIFEAMNHGAGVRLHPFSLSLEETFKDHGKVWWCPLIRTCFSGEAIVGAALELWGHEYPTTIEMLAIRSRLIRWFLKKIKHPAGARTDHCSEVVTRAFKKNGYHVTKPPFYVYPIDVVNFSCFHERIEIEK